MKTDGIVSIIFILLSILFYEGTHHLGYTSAIFPKAMAVALLIFSIILFFISLFSKGETHVKKEIVIKPNDVAYLTAIIFISFIWIFFIQIIGFITTSVISLTLMTEVLSTKRPIRFEEIAYTILIYLLLSGGIWVALSKFLAVPLPRGILIRKCQSLKILQKEDLTAPSTKYNILYFLYLTKHDVIRNKIIVMRVY